MGKRRLLCPDHVSDCPNPAPHAKKRALKPSAYPSPQGQADADLVAHQHPLVRLLTLYPFLDSIVPKIAAKDLLSLALTSRLAYHYIFRSEKSRIALLSRTRCDSSGIGIRQMHHQKYFDGVIVPEDYVVCGSNDKSRVVPSKPCGSCGVNTCDECRIHITYQAHYRPPDAPDEFPYWSGYAMLSLSEMPIIGPQEYGLPEVWEPPGDRYPRSDPHHDQGSLGLPFDDGSSVESDRPVESIINMDLGHNYDLRSYDAPSSGGPASRILAPFWGVVEARKRLYCPDCFERREGKKDHNSKCKCEGCPPASKYCHCTLKARFLDRWLCLLCYQREQQSLAEQPGAKKENFEHDIRSYKCSCGVQLAKDYNVILCLWCDRPVISDSSLSR
ncbi:hypothetical protein GQ43DRAFT_439022 [Delitschia confertaspora ATCC 74209]|uniref:Uncharacterized protein n=1 Tax=Delitschia confertaspora ATCC 74209 TaxID=1513339 RepID=A0A9P4JQ87_9PLEO|nr:hypothetical protein GQ43DRAFT_439022 [Delitschia confertaspora ATCC 74209]